MPQHLPQGVGLRALLRPVAITITVYGPRSRQPAGAQGRRERGGGGPLRLGQGQQLPGGGLGRGLPAQRPLPVLGEHLGYLVQHPRRHLHRPGQMQEPLPVRRRLRVHPQGGGELPGRLRRREGRAVGVRAIVRPVALSRWQGGVPRWATARVSRVAGSAPSASSRLSSPRTFSGSA